MSKTNDGDLHDAKEAAQRRDDALHHALSMPPQPKRMKAPGHSEAAADTHEMLGMGWRRRTA